MSPPAQSCQHRTCQSPASTNRIKYNRVRWQRECCSAGCCVSSSGPANSEDAWLCSWPRICSPLQTARLQQHLRHTRHNNFLLCAPAARCCSAPAPAPSSQGSVEAGFRAAALAAAATWTACSLQQHHIRHIVQHSRHAQFESMRMPVHQQRIIIMKA